MHTSNLGNHLNELVSNARGRLFHQSELAQLTFGAFNIAYREVEADRNETIELAVPIGMNAENKPVTSSVKYGKQALLDQYKFLALKQLAVNGTFHLVTIIEAMTEDILRAIITKYPRKLGGDKKIPLDIVLSSASLEAIQIYALEVFLNDMGYESPANYAKAVEKLTGINLLECIPFHRYLELKATRDIHIHNRGFANSAYIKRANQHARVTVGNFLPVDGQYFLASFEHCVQLTEWWEENLHEKWPSSEYESRAANSDAIKDAAGTPPSDHMSEQLRLLAQELTNKKVNDAEL